MRRDLPSLRGLCDGAISNPGSGPVITIDIEARLAQAAGKLRDVTTPGHERSMNALRKARQLHAMSKRAVAIGERCRESLRKDLPRAVWAAFASDTCKDVRAAYVRSVTDLAARMEMFDGSPAAVLAMNRATQGYLAAYRDAAARAAEVAT